jgi:hypothetical protein
MVDALMVHGWMVALTLALELGGVCCGWIGLIGLAWSRDQLGEMVLWAELLAEPLRMENSGVWSVAIARSRVDEDTASGPVEDRSSIHGDSRAEDGGDGRQFCCRNEVASGFRGSLTRSLLSGGSHSQKI